MEKIERSIWINAPRERVWQAITNPEQIQQWFSPTIPWAASALEVGGRLYAVGYEAQAVTIDVLDAPRQFTYRLDDASSGTLSSFITTFTLEEENGGTRVTVSDTVSGTVSEEARKQHLEQKDGGWAVLLPNLQAYVEGKPLPFTG